MVSTQIDERIVELISSKSSILMKQRTELGLPYPTPTTPAAANRMRANRRSDTQPEVLLRSLLHRSGLRFRKDHQIRLFTGRVVRADIAFTGKRLAVFVDGCFWHSCPLHGTVPKSNRDYWVPKLKQNVDRDKLVNQLLESTGWTVVRIWEHTDQESARLEIISLLRVLGRHSS